MTEDEKSKIKNYKDYPEGSGKKGIFDYVFLSFKDYINKYYQSPDISTWEIWQAKYIEPAFDESRHEEMIKNFGYVSIDKHDFKSQYAIYNQLKEDNRLDDETVKFIGFMAGAGFFEKLNINLEEWFDVDNWSAPLLFPDNNKRMSINDILSYTYGLNYLKVNLPQMSFWNR
jgi:hypothetical protein